jgi:hypothetical protein
MVDVADAERKDGHMFAAMVDRDAVAERDKPLDDIRTDELGTANDENLHGRVFLWLSSHDLNAGPACDGMEAPSVKDD